MNRQLLKNFVDDKIGNRWSIQRIYFFCFCAMFLNFILGLLYIIFSVIYLSLYLGYYGIYNIIFAVIRIYAIKMTANQKNIDMTQGSTATSETNCKYLKKIFVLTFIATTIFLIFGIVTTFFCEQAVQYGQAFALFVYIVNLSKFFICVAMFFINKNNPNTIAQIFR